MRSCLLFSNRAASKVTKDLREISIFSWKHRRSLFGNQPTGKYPLVRRRVRPSQCRAMACQRFGGRAMGGEGVAQGSACTHCPLACHITHRHKH